MTGSNNNALDQISTLREKTWKWAKKARESLISGSLFTLKKPVSKRFFQLGFVSFKPEGKSKIEQFLNIWLEFFKRLALYGWNKLYALLYIIPRLVRFLLKFPPQFKEYLVRKLIWSRGKLGRSIATWFILLVSFSVFFVGEVFSGSTLVFEQKVQADYLSTPTDIIPKKEVALTTVPEERKKAEAFIYSVQSGDTLYSIGSKFKISVDALEYVNGLSDITVLKVGQELTIPPSLGLIHTVKSGDSLSSIALKYDVAVQAIADFNYLFESTGLAVGTELVIPGAKIPVAPVIIPVTPSSPSTTVGPNKSLCVWPTTVRYISQYFSWYHNGLDIASSASGPMPPLLTCASGTVVRAGWDPFGLGLHVRIDHGNGYETVYGHMSRIDVSYGEKISRGEVIGLMGSTGNSTGPHIHFIVKYNGVAQNPLDFTN
ncbi:hypothetical protein A3K34_00475 [candidate division WWE3 bacterium RIFOXYC1_FULL_40_10]|uniref:LysM domain-containing protein n=1 Tax=candidate division WWE3 bacterium RIFOXYA2_FULL_46_9 TaxID=1802636 RepID=A0A1F4VYU9_UNCKA|nr:MAG: hypothetical protein A3K58_00475 [candidate division WWE3 bacterium RIFOXYB1_FULL_40_22]OGC61360.1 MAG: hypothetical protein A3K37_00475 [candidate division WWE3 bacterium RIFOXYA1_FULL_40_11]OGC62356.1 MAG: hypothetical protein A2264_05310 [candidate division WWE3 bacterium RIFOXYA2_FULL_46_9]OGC65350.1 MAG: hypothetical protein A2326_04760 [candidate division WWE3 bacterium RIFOXYB2_FULL_41_6]OGC65743.1 MAG: hypothetical protein A3K34_00475 [candidate division WWE3 bacterium RIFOXYC1_